MQHLIYSLVVGVIMTALLVLVFLMVGKKDKSQREQERDLVLGCGDEGLIALYEQAANDQERDDIVAFVKEKLALDRPALAAGSEDADAFAEPEPRRKKRFGRRRDEDVFADDLGASRPAPAASEVTLPTTAPDPVVAAAPEAEAPETEPMTLEQYIAAQFAQMDDPDAGLAAASQKPQTPPSAAPTGAPATEPLSAKPAASVSEPFAAAKPETTIPATPVAEPATATPAAAMPPAEPSASAFGAAIPPVEPVPAVPVPPLAESLAATPPVVPEPVATVQPSVPPRKQPQAADFWSRETRPTRSFAPKAEPPSLEPPAAPVPVPPLAPPEPLTAASGLPPELGTVPPVPDFWSTSPTGATAPVAPVAPVQPAPQATAPQATASQPAAPAVAPPSHTIPGLANVFAGSAMTGLAGEAEARAAAEAEISAGLQHNPEDEETRALPLDEVDWRAVEAELQRKREEQARIMAQNIHIQEVFEKVKNVEGKILHHEPPEKK